MPTHCLTTVLTFDQLPLFQMSLSYLVTPFMFLFHLLKLSAKLGHRWDRRKPITSSLTQFHQSYLDLWLLNQKSQPHHISDVPHVLKFGDSTFNYFQFYCAGDHTHTQTDIWGLLQYPHSRLQA